MSWKYWIFAYILHKIQKMNPEFNLLSGEFISNHLQIYIKDNRFLTIFKIFDYL